VKARALFIPQFQNDRKTTAPFHKGRDISPIFLRQIAKDIGLSVEELLKYK